VRSRNSSPLQARAAAANPYFDSIDPGRTIAMQHITPKGDAFRSQLP
jgi:hypothetical protein